MHFSESYIFIYCSSISFSYFMFDSILEKDHCPVRGKLLKVTVHFKFIKRIIMEDQMVGVNLHFPYTNIFQ